MNKDTINRDVTKTRAISGILIKDELERKSKSMSYQEYTANYIGKAVARNKACLETQTDQINNSESGFKSLLNFKTEKPRDCILIDEKDPHRREKTLRIPKGSIDIDNVFNLKHKRKVDIYNPAIDKVKFKILEGASVTLLGLVKYNLETGEFEMTQLSTVLAGGMQEVRAGLEERISHLNDTYWQFAVIGFALITVAGAVHYKKYCDRLRREARRE